MKKVTPKRKVGLITFNHEVQIFGDGSNEPVIITGAKLNSEKDIEAVIMKCEHLLQCPIGQSAETLVKKV